MIERPIAVNAFFGSLTPRLTASLTGVVYFCYRHYTNHLTMKNLIYFIVLLLCLGSCQSSDGPDDVPGDDGLKVVSGTREQLRVDYADDDPRQYLIVFTPGLARKCPVYLWAHTNSWDPVNNPLRPEDTPKDILDPLLDHGIAVVSWESVNQVETNNDIKTCEADLKLVYAWLREHAGEYLLNLDSLYVGGGSRGSIVSWRFIHENPRLVRGGWFGEALPYPAGTSFEIVNTVRNTSPHVRLTYKYNQETHPAEEIHNPKYGWKVFRKYEELGIGDRIEILEDMGDAYYNGLWKFIRNPAQKPSSRNNDPQ